MADILLFGPHGAGKTQLVYSLRNEEYTNPMQTGEEDYKAKKSGPWWKFGLSKFSLHEIGGKDRYYKDKDFLTSAFQTNERLVFVFNGNDFIKELINYQSGGLITSLLRCHIMPVLSKCGKQKSIQFVATYEDEYLGNKPDMASEIISCIEYANNEYREEAHSTRYTFKELMHGNLFCVDARDPQKVKEIFKQINKS